MYILCCWLSLAYLFIFILSNGLQFILNGYYKAFDKFVSVCQQKKDAQLYNNGIHSIDGGKWIYKDTSGKYGGYYTFECSKCGEFVTLYGVDGN